MSETYTIKYSTKAINDLRDIYSYIAFIYKLLKQRRKW